MEHPQTCACTVRWVYAIDGVVGGGAGWDARRSFDPSSIPQEYLERFQGMAMPDRIFVYPASEP